MIPPDFDRLVTRAVAKIPSRFRRRIANIAFIVEPEPSPAQLHAAGVRSGGN